MNKQTISNALKGAEKALKKHSPEILTGIGIAGMIATTISAVKATPKAPRLIDEKEIQENKRLTTAEVVLTTWKCYIPAAVTGALSVACLIGASAVSLKRNAALATAYTISETALKDYREKAVEVVGEKKEQAIRDAIAKDKLAGNPVDDKQIVMTGSGDTLCYDVLSGRYFKSDIEKIRKAINDLNRDMLSEQYVSLNDLTTQSVCPTSSWVMTLAGTSTRATLRYSLGRTWPPTERPAWCWPIPLHLSMAITF